MNMIKPIKVLLLIPFWLTPWGKALCQISWDLYRNSELFELRTQAFGTTFAARSFTLGEFWFFLDKAVKRNRFSFRFIFAPYSILDELCEKDRFLKSMVNFDIV